MTNVRRLICAYLSLVSNICSSLSQNVCLPIQEKRWQFEDGNKTHLLNHNLNKSSLVFDVGGYEGQWTSDIFSKYCCTIHIFEPVNEFANKIEKRFSKNKKIIIHKFGLSSENKKASISLEQDSSSIFRKGKKSQEIILVKASDFLQNNDIKKIDLMSINIECGEYDLLEHLIRTKYIKHIRNIQVQFHDFIPGTKKRMQNIQLQLNKTHFLTYQYPFVWENWKLRER